MTTPVGIIKIGTEDPFLRKDTGVFLSADIIESNFIKTVLARIIDTRKMRLSSPHEDEPEQAEKEEKDQNRGKSHQKTGAADQNDVNASEDETSRDDNEKNKNNGTHGGSFPIGIASDFSISCEQVADKGTAQDGDRRIAVSPCKNAGTAASGGERDKEREEAEP